MRQKPDPKIILICIILIALVGTAVYFNSLSGKFVWDDFLLVKQNTLIKSWSGLPKVFQTNIGEGFGKDYNFYRPVQMLTYMFDNSLWALNPMGYHLTNVLLHILVALCIFWFIIVLYDDWLLSFLAGVLFVVHPLHTEAAAYISGRADLLAALFMLLSFICYIKYLDGKKLLYCILAGASFVLALLSKEYSLILPVLLVLYHFAFKKEPEEKSALTMVGIFFVYILLRSTVLKSALAETIYPTTLIERIPGFFAAITNYIKLLILPFNLHMEYGNRLFQFSDPKMIGGVVILTSSLACAFWIRKRSSLVFFSILWFIITILPVSNLYPINAYMAEHWLYFPSVGIFLLVAGGLCFLFDKKGGLKTLSIVLAAGLTGFFSLRTVQQNTYWKDPIEFSTRTLKYAYESPRLHYNLGILYKDIGRNEEAIEAYKKAIKLKPRYATAYNNLGSAYAAAGREEEAIGAFEKSVEIDPNYADAYYNLGNAYQSADESEKAVLAYTEAINIRPDNALAYNNMGSVYGLIGQEEKAAEAFRKALAINPNYVEAYQNLAKLHESFGEQEERIKILEKAVQMNPGNAASLNVLGNAYFSAGHREKALGAFKKAVGIDPNFADAYNNLANTYALTGQTDKAIEMYKKAMQIKPDDPAPHFNMGRLYSLLGRHEEAVSAYKKSVELDPENPQTYNFLGNSYHSLGLREEAIGAYKKAIELDPGFAAAYYNLANEYAYIGRYNEAIPLYEKAVEIDPKYIDAFNNLGMVYKNMKNFDKSIDAFKKAIELDPGYARAHYNLSWIYYQKEEYALALEHAEKAKTLGYDVDPAFIKALEAKNNE